MIMSSYYVFWQGIDAPQVYRRSIQRYGKTCYGKVKLDVTKFLYGKFGISEIQNLDE